MICNNCNREIKEYSDRYRYEDSEKNLMHPDNRIFEMEYKCPLCGHALSYLQLDTDYFMVLIMNSRINNKDKGRAIFRYFQMDDLIMEQEKE